MAQYYIVNHPTNVKTSKDFKGNTHVKNIL